MDGFDINLCFFFLKFYPAVPQLQFFGLKASKLLRAEGSRVGMPLAGNVVQASTAAAQETSLEWVKKDKRRMLHVVYRVGDLDRTIKYVISRYSTVYISFVNLMVGKQNLFKQSLGLNF